MQVMVRLMHPKGKNPWYPLDRRLDAVREEKNVLPKLGIDPETV
jgi:hypothetical protein